jgi:hypothetical protein
MEPPRAEITSERGLEHHSSKPDAFLARYVESIVKVSMERWLPLIRPAQIQSGGR